MERYDEFLSGDKDDGKGVGRRLLLSEYLNVAGE